MDCHCHPPQTFSSFLYTLLRPGDQDLCLAIPTHLYTRVYLCVNGLIHRQYIHSHLYINTCNYRFPESTANTILLNANTQISAPQTHTCMLSGWTWVPPPHIPTNALNPAQTHLPDLRVEVWLESIEGGRECDKPARTEPALLAFQEGRR